MKRAEELAEKARIEIENKKYSIKALSSSASTLLTRGLLDYKNESLESAYLSLMRACIIVVEIIPHHHEFTPALKRDPTYKDLKKRAEQSLKILEEMKDKINKAASPITPAKTLAPPPISITNIPSTLKPRHFSSHILPSELIESIPLENILFLDIRPRNEFMKGHIHSTNILQLEPSLLKKGIASGDIERHLRSSPKELSLFKSRTKFEYVVYYDYNSSQLEWIIAEPLKILVEAIYEREFTNCLKRMPMMLVGGWESWMKLTKGDTKWCIIPTTESTAKLLSGLSISDGDKIRKEDISSQNSQTVIRSVNDFFHNSFSQAQPHSMLSGQTAGILKSSTSSTLYGWKPEPFITKRTSSLEALAASKQKQASAVEKLPIIPIRRSSSRQHFDDPYFGFGTPPSAPSSEEKDVKSSLHETIVKQTQHNLQPIVPSAPSSPELSNLMKRFVISNSTFSQLGTVSIGLAGLSNLGNTCFFNAAIQCLSGSKPLSRYFLDGSYKKHLNRSNVMGTGGVVGESYATLIRMMWTSQQTVISPAEFRDVICQYNPQFQNYDQQDSQEFLAYLLDSLHEDLNLVTKKTAIPEKEYDRIETMPEKEGSATAWDYYLKNNSSIIVYLFQGQLKSHLECTVCSKVSVTYSAFMQLSLPIPNKKDVSIEDCWKEFISEEILDGDNAWNCPNCKRPQRSSKALSVTKLPPLLILHLKRFQSSGIFRDKIDKLIKFPLSNFDLLPLVSLKSGSFDEGLTSYDAYAVINHYGSLNGGHYTASVRDMHRASWHYIDDTRISSINEDAVMTKAAYTIFYVRKQF